MKKVFITTITVVATIGLSYRVINNVVSGTTNIIDSQVEAVAPITECYSIKKDKQTGETVTKTYPC